MMETPSDTVEEEEEPDREEASGEEDDAVGVISCSVLEGVSCD